MTSLASDPSDIHVPGLRDLAMIRFLAWLVLPLILTAIPDFPYDVLTAFKAIESDDGGINFRPHLEGMFRVSSFIFQSPFLLLLLGQIIILFKCRSTGMLLLNTILLQIGVPLAICCWSYFGFVHPATLEPLYERPYSQLFVSVFMEGVRKMVQVGFPVAVALLFSRSRPDSAAFLLVCAMNTAGVFGLFYIGMPRITETFDGVPDMRAFDLGNSFVLYYAFSGGMQILWTMLFLMDSKAVKALARVRAFGAPIRAGLAAVAFAGLACAWTQSRMDRDLVSFMAHWGPVPRTDPEKPSPAWHVWRREFASLPDLQYEFGKTPSVQVVRTGEALVISTPELGMYEALYQTPPGQLAELFDFVGDDAVNAFSNAHAKHLAAWRSVVQMETLSFWDGNRHRFDGHTGTRAVARFLAYRAKYAIYKGDAASALADAGLILQMSDLLQSEGSLISFMIGTALRMSMNDALYAYFLAFRDNPTRIAELRAFLDRPEARPDPRFPFERLRGYEPEFWRIVPFAEIVHGGKSKPVGMARMRTIEHDQLRLSIALDEFRRARGTLPQFLRELAPEFIADVPLDPMSGDPYRFRRTEDDFTISSPGLENLRDIFPADRFRTFQDAPSKVRNEDLAKTLEHARKRRLEGAPGP